MKKRLFLLVLCLIVLLGIFAPAALAAEGIAITVDGAPLVFEEGAQEPVMENGRVLVPMRKIFEALSCTVDYAGGVIDVSGSGLKITMKIGDTKASVNGNEVILDVPPKVVKGSTLVPVRFVSENSGAQVNWNGATNTVEIIRPATGAGMVFDKKTNTITGYSGNDRIITIPEKIDGVAVKKIGENVFSNNSLITKVVISEGVLEIGEGSFSALDNLAEIVLPDSLKKLDYAFHSLPKLKQINIGLGLMDTGGSFHNCDNLETINVAIENPYLVVKDGVLFKKDMKTILLYPGGRMTFSYTMPNGVETIGVACFMGHNYLRDITLPDSLRYIEYGAFYGVWGLTNVVLPANTREIQAAAFSECINLETLVIPRSVYKIYYYNNEILGEIHPFSGCEDLTLICESGSYAEYCAKHWDIPYRNKLEQ